MLKNYLKLGFRNLWKNRSLTAINLFGLAIGISSCLLIMIFVYHELSYDRFNTNADRMYRVVLDGKMQGGDIREANVMPPVAQVLKNDFPEVEAATRIRTVGAPRVNYGEKVFRDNQMAFVDSNFFQFFTIALVRGDAKTALMRPNSIIISRGVAEKYFGNDDPIGKVLSFKDNNALFTVTGEIDAVPDNAHFHFDLFASMSGLDEARSPSWMQSNFFTYVQLPEDYDYKKLEAKLPQTVKKYLGPQLMQGMGVTFEQFTQNGNTIRFSLQPITDIHLKSNLSGDMEPGGNMNYVYIFGAVALFMLLIACINFMNLSTASASKRAREVGMRKVMGSLKKQLVAQFMTESLILTAVALALSLGIVYAALPFFNQLAEQKLSLQLTAHAWTVPALVAFTIVTALLAGSYPAFFLSSFNPVTVLKGKFTSGKGSAGIRNGLVVFQFIISIGLIIGTTVVYKQLDYIQHKNLGYDKEQVVIVQDTYWLGNNAEAFKQQLMADPRVVSVSASGYLPAGPSNSNNFFVYADNKSSELIKTLRYDADYGYIPTLGMQLASGRNFSRDYGADSAAVIVNETAATGFGWGEKAIGHTITHQDNDGKITSYRVIGVVKDFHFRSLHQKIDPLVMTLGSDNGTMIVKVKTAAISGLLSTMKSRWTELNAEVPFSYSFLDERFEKMYKSEQNIGKILALFAGLTIFVACLGLFALATFTAEQRTREIGIRKVLGADVGGLVTLLSIHFVKLVCISFVIASPLAWIAMNRWLQDFAYRVDISFWIFLLAGMAALIITLATISFQAIRAARANPIQSLRAD